MKITIRNDFHHTEVTVYDMARGWLSPDQVRRAKRELCGHRGCTCSDFLGASGEQDPHTDDARLHLHYEPRNDGGAELWFEDPRGEA